MPFRLTIKKKSVLIISLPLMFQLVFIGFLMRIRNDAIEAERMALHSKEVLLRTENGFGLIVEAVGASRGYIISQNPVFQDEAEQAAKNGLKQFDALITLTRDNPSQQHLLESIRSSAAAVTEWQASQRSRVNAGNLPEALARTRDLSGKNLLDNLRGKLDQFLREEERLQSERQAELVRTRKVQAWGLGIGALVSTVLACGSVIAMSRSITSRLGTVTKNAERLAENQALQARIAGEDEIARLDQVVHETSQRLRESAAKEDQYRTELEIRASELNRTNEDLRQQTQENEMFVYSVSHDLRSPLVNLQGFTKELTYAGDELAGLLSDQRIPQDIQNTARNIINNDVSDSVKFIQSAVSRSSLIIDALLRLSRAGRVEYRLQSIDIAAIVQRIISAMRSTIDQKNVEIVIGELLPAWGDPTAIEQVFGNLIGNAVNYLDPARPGRIEIGMLNQGTIDGDNLRTYYVKDNGLGISSAYLGKVFVAFQRLHGDIAKGEGIGLALVRRMVERHNGRVRVESVEKEGSTFFVSLPIETQPG